MMYMQATNYVSFLFYLADFLSVAELEPKNIHVNHENKPSWFWNFVWSFKINRFLYKIMLSWYGISAAFGIICVLFTLVVIAYLVWNTKQLINQWVSMGIRTSKCHSNDQIQHRPTLLVQKCRSIYEKILKKFKSFTIIQSYLTQIQTTETRLSMLLSTMTKMLGLTGTLLFRLITKFRL